MKRILVVLAILYVTFANAASIAIAHVQGTVNDPGVNGVVYFVQLNSTHHWVSVDISGITVNASGWHGAHVHEYGDLTEPRALAAGLHFIGRGASRHACEDTSNRHEGDMGNWNATSGSIKTTKIMDLLDTTGNTSIIGKAFILHSGADDCISQPVGAAGARIAAGVIGVANPNYVPKEVLTVAGGLATPNNAVSGDQTILKAVAILKPTVASPSFTVTGLVTFEQDPLSSAVTVTGQFFGLTPSNAYGFHIHMYADYLTGNVVNGTAAGGHFDPHGDPHGAPPNATRHAGDLGNICSYSGKTAYYKYVITDGKLSLNGASNNILGRNIIVHDTFDAARPNSPFGLRISQGVIGVLNNTAPPLITIPNDLKSINDPLCLAFAPTPSPSTPPPSTPPPSFSATTSGGGTTEVATSSAPSLLVFSLFVSSSLLFFAGLSLII